MSAEASRREFLRAATGAGVAAAGAASAGTASAQESATVEVGPGGELVYTPEELYVTPGTTVTFEWGSNNHNVVPESIPDGAEWSGTAGAPSETYDTGYTYEHTFETKGEYSYFCQPHKGVGMVASVIVNDEGAPPSSGGGGGPTLPDSAKTLAIATMAAMMSTLALAFFFLKYGGDYGTVAE
jgi:plastocyanin